MKRIQLLVALSVLSAGCLGGFRTSQVITGKPGAPHTGPIKVVMEGGTAPASFEEVAVLQSVGYGTDANLASVVESLRQQAAPLGCDAIIRIHVDQGSGMTSGSGVCIRTTAQASNAGSL